MLNNSTVYAGSNEILRAAIYCRLSKDDDDREGESASIQNQRDLLENHCAVKGWEVVAVYQDDGYTGLNIVVTTKPAPRGLCSCRKFIASPGRSPANA